MYTDSTTPTTTHKSGGPHQTTNKKEIKKTRMTKACRCHQLTPLSSYHTLTTTITQATSFELSVADNNHDLHCL
jgi:hypothetical protein